MFARLVYIKPKIDSASKLARAIENDVIPLIRKQKGFYDESAFIVPDFLEIGIVINFWDEKKEAAASIRAEYPNIVNALSEAVEGTPLVETFEDELVSRGFYFDVKEYLF
jgi:hypothetical protein